MIFAKLRKFTRSHAQTAPEIFRYLTEDLAAALDELNLGLSRLKFTENFRTFSVDVEFAPGQELRIRNLLREGKIPSGRLIVRSNSSEIVDGDTEWTKDYVYLKNLGAGGARATVIFFE